MSNVNIHDILKEQSAFNIIKACTNFKTWIYNQRKHDYDYLISFPFYSHRSCNMIPCSDIITWLFKYVKRISEGLMQSVRTDNPSQILKTRIISQESVVDLERGHSHCRPRLYWSQGPSSGKLGRISRLRAWPWGFGRRINLCYSELVIALWTLYNW